MKFSLILLPLVCLLSLPAQAQTRTRIVDLTNHGFTISVSSDMRAMATTDGGVRILDQETYERIVCNHTVPDCKSQGGSGFDSIDISTATKGTVLRPVPGKNNMYLVLKTSVYGGRYVVLRVKTPKGTFDVENAYEGSQDMSEQEIKDNAARLLELAQSIKISD